MLRAEDVRFRKTNKNTVVKKVREGTRSVDFNWLSLFALITFLTDAVVACSLHVELYTWTQFIFGRISHVSRGSVH